MSNVYILAPVSLKHTNHLSCRNSAPYRHFCTPLCINKKLSEDKDKERGEESAIR